MLNISYELKEILKHDYLPYRAPVDKSLVLYFADLDLTITEMYNDDFSFKDSLCGDTLTFGACNSASIKFQVEDIAQDLVGHKFSAKFVIGETEIPLGKYIVLEAPKADDDNVKAVVTYDLMSNFDIDVTEWYNDIDFESGVTLKEFRESLCIYCGVPYENSNLPNDNMIVERTISTNQFKGRDVLIRCEELNGCFGHMNKYGKLDHIVLCQSNPVDTLDNTAYDNLVLEEYTADTITKVQIRQEDGDVGAYYGEGTNCYSITGNFLVYGKSASELATIVQNVAPNIIGITYRPYEYVGQGLPYLDVGDYVTFNGEEAVNSYIMSNEITGTQILDGTMLAKGDKTLSEDTGVNVQIEQLRGKSNVLKRTVEEMSNTITNLETTTSTLRSGVTGLEQELNDVAIDISDVVSNLQSEIDRATGVEANMYTKSQTDSKISQSATSIINEVSSSYATKLEVQTVDGKLTNYVKTADYNTKVTALTTGLSAEVTAREELKKSITGTGCTIGDKCVIGESCIIGPGVDCVTNNILKDTNAKVELLSTQFAIELQDNVDELNANWTVATTNITASISNAKTDSQTKFEMLENSIELCAKTGELSASISLENGTVSFTGNRFNWTSTYSSMSNDGTLTCQNIIATNGRFSGAITGSSITGSSFSSSGSYGTMNLNDGRLYFSSSSGAGYISPSAFSVTSGSSEGLVMPNYIRAYDASTGYSTVMTGTYISVAGSTVLTLGNYTSYCAPLSHAHGTLYANSSFSSISAYFSSVGNFVSSSANTIGTSSNVWVGAYLGSSTMVVSDIRKKHDIEKLDNRYDSLILNIETNRYKYNSGTSDRYHTGLIAQQVEGLMKEVGIESTEFAGLIKSPVYDVYDDEGEPTNESKIIDYDYGLRYEEFISPMINMIQKLNKRVSELEERLCQV